MKLLKIQSEDEDESVTKENFF